MDHTQVPHCQLSSLEQLSSKRGGYGQRTGTPMSATERARRYRARLKAAKAHLVNNSDSARTPMSGAERARRFRERLKAAKKRLVNNADSTSTFTPAADFTSTSTSGAPTSTSTTAVPVPMDILNEDTNHTSGWHGTLSKQHRLREHYYHWCTFFDMKRI